MAQNVTQYCHVCKSQTTSGPPVLALAENLLPYLVFLSWYLKDDKREKLTISLANFHCAPSPPSLKVIAKSVLALVNGLDVVYKL